MSIIKWECVWNPNDYVIVFEKKGVSLCAEYVDL